MAVSIHPLAVVSPTATLGLDVQIGPFCFVGPLAKIGDRTVLRSHVSLTGNTSLGPDCTVWPFASVGGKTQDLKFKGGHPRLRVGPRTVIRECATLSCATFDEGETRVGADCLLMAYCHVAHDCIVGNRVILANNATLAGHVIIEDDAILGGMAGVHQFVRIGRMSILGGCTKAVKDIPPYMMADGDPLHVFGPNRVGLLRHHVSAEAQAALKKAYKLVFHSNLTVAKALEQVETQLPPLPEIQHYIAFIRASQRGIAR